MVHLPELKRDGTSLHQSLKYAICEALDTGLYLHGEKMPSENTIASHYGLSRHVVRQALERLVAEGRLRVSQGAGYFVNDQRFAIELPFFAQFTETMRKADAQSTVVLLSREYVSASPRVAKSLGIRSGSRVMRLVRAGMVGPEAVAILEGYYPRNASKLLEDADLDHGVYAVLESHGVRPTSGENLLSVSFADATLAAQMGVPEGGAIVEVVSTAIDSSGAPVEYVRAAYRADRFAFHYIALASDDQPTANSIRGR